MKIQKKFIILLSLIIFSVFINCTKVQYTKSIDINAPYEKNFIIEMKNKLFQAFDKELQLVKEYSEKIWRENENSRL